MVFILTMVFILQLIGCQNKNELNLNTLKINVTLNTPIDLDNSVWLSTLFQSFQVNNINYVSRNNNNKIGINIIRGDLPKKIYAVNLPLQIGNGIKLSMDVYDNTNLSDDLENFNLKSVFNENNLYAYVTNQFTGNLAVENKNLVIDLNNPISEAKLKKEIASFISKNKNQCVINVVVKKSNKKQMPIPFNPPGPTDQTGLTAKETTFKDPKDPDIAVEPNKTISSSKANADFYSQKKLILTKDLNKIKWRNFGEISYKIEFVDYYSEKVCCWTVVKTNEVTAAYLLETLNCIKPSNRYLIKISTIAKIDGYPEKFGCCSIGFESGRFSEDCSCENNCEL